MGASLCYPEIYPREGAPYVWCTVTAPILQRTRCRETSFWKVGQERLVARGRARDRAGDFYTRLPRRLNPAMTALPNPRDFNVR